ncbi:hypothetical protein DRN86_00290 [Candidatus Geothermarchaeota archaeon]|nr:MAG: hypothetical protein DRN86_00290 [Candidatus Geothermarchaeota archaeon]
MVICLGNLDEIAEEEFSIVGYLRGLSSFLISTVLLFLFFTYLGMMANRLFFSEVIPMLNPIKELVRYLKGLNEIEMFLVVFLNNSIKGLLNIVLGVLFGVYPLVFIVINAFVVGFTAEYISASQGPLVAALGLIPHGILEIPAVLICAAMGFKMAVETIKSIIGKGKLEIEIKKALKVYLYLILPLLLIAAFIEVFITPHLIDFAISLKMHPSLLP